MNESEFWETTEGIKASYYFDCSWQFRYAKDCIKLGHFWGWEYLNQFFINRRKFHEKLKHNDTTI